MGKFETIKTEAVGKEMSELVRTGANGEVAYDTDILNDFKALGVAHQPVVIAADASGSMSADAGNGTSKLDMCQTLINGLRQSDAMKQLGPVEMNSVDMMVLSFEGSDVVLQSPWAPLSLFEGIPNLQPGGGTPLYKTFIETILATRVIRHQYGKNGIECYRPQVFIYTDGAATDLSLRDEAKKLIQEYASKEAGKVKIYVVLVPGAMSDEDVKRVTMDILDLSDNITVIKAVDCVNGLPATFNFLASSVVVGSSTPVGEEMRIKYDNANMKVANNTDVQNGEVVTGTQETISDPIFV